MQMTVTTVSIGTRNTCSAVAKGLSQGET